MIEGLPADATEREVAHIFRPFVGYKATKIQATTPKSQNKSEIGDSDQSFPHLANNNQVKKEDIKKEHLLCYVHFENTMQSTAVISTV